MIPKRIHHVWENKGTNQAPQAVMNTWKKHHPDWEIIVWNEDNLPIDLLCKQQLDWTIRLCKRSDIIRLEMLYRYGGVYTDCDFVCLKPFNKFLGLPFFAGLQGTGPRNSIICNALMGCEPGNLVIKKMLDLIKTYDEKTCKSNGAVTLTGNYPLRKIWNSTSQTNRGILFPFYYFYPLTNTDFPNGNLPIDWRERSSRSYAIHLWTGQFTYNFANSPALAEMLSAPIPTRVSTED